MTDHNLPVVGGEPVNVFVERRLDDHLVPTVLDALISEIPVYARLPRELIEGDVRSVVRLALATFGQAIAHSGAIDQDALHRLTESAGRRAEEGVPMDMVLAAYFQGASVCLAALESQATLEDFDDVLRVTQMLVRFMQQVTTSVAAGYSSHNASAIADQASARQLLINALLDGADVELAANRAGVRLAARYLVLSLVTGTHPDEVDPGVDSQVAGRRKLRRLHEELERHYPELLWMPSTDGGLALVPADGAAERRLPGVVRELELATGALVHVGIVVAVPDGIGQAARTARDVADVAHRLGRASGAFHLQDVALEYQLTRPTPARGMLADLLAPLRGQPDLTRTLRTYLDNAHRRRDTAASLGVHPNTVDNRLKRIAALTGLDPLRPADLPLVTAALAAGASTLDGG